MRRIQRHLAIWLTIAQLLILIPFAAIPALAEEKQNNSSEAPILNETVVGSVDFQSFNFLGDNINGIDGIDYNTTFYYTDDYFSPSAINEDASAKSLPWSALEDTSMAACSMDFAVASYTSAVGDVISASDQTWNNTDYTGEVGFHAPPEHGKAENVFQFLSKCGFHDIQPVALNERPTMDSIGYTLANKEITVWNPETESNETCTLVAVGVRGAGYGAEWASNVSIGDPATKQLPANGRHYGFDHSAQIVCNGIRDYLSANGITRNVKYWIAGFSRAAAVANLTAAYLTDNSDVYHTSGRMTEGSPDVYAYTYECPQAASTTEPAMNYKNIHNIINAMDAVPKVSPSAFEHQRLGVDYVMPYHKNTSTSDNSKYYNRMYEVLKTIATGTDADGNADPLIDAVNPSNYPFDRAMKIYRLDATTLMWQAIWYAAGTSDTLMKEFGTEEAEQRHGFLNSSGNVDHLLGWNGKNDYKTSTWYLDDYIDNLVSVFLTSNAWVGSIGNDRTELENRATFISDYQEDFRILFGYFLDFSGPAFLGMVQQLIGAISEKMGSTILSGFPAAFIAFYNFPTNNTFKNSVINSGREIAVEVANEMTKDFPNPEMQGIKKKQMNDALEHLVALVFNLFAYEKSYFSSQYLGTTLRCLNTILCTHEQETVLSWIMSLDENHINRSFRTITLPLSTDVKLYRFREGLDDSLGFDSKGALVAEFDNGSEVSSLDQRIYKTISGNNIIIRYPASLDIRLDITSEDEVSLRDISLSDYKTGTANNSSYVAETAGVSLGKEMYQTVNTKVNGIDYYSTLSGTNATSVKNAVSDLSLSGRYQLQITAAAAESYNATRDRQGNPVYDWNLIPVSKGGNTVTAQKGDTTLKTFLGEDADGTYWMLVTAGSSSNISGKTLKTQINTQNFDISDATYSVNGGVETKLDDDDLTLNGISINAGKTYNVVIDHLVPLVGGDEVKVGSAQFNGATVSASATDIPKLTKLIDYGTKAVIAEDVAKVAQDVPAMELDEGKLLFTASAPQLAGDNITQNEAADLTGINAKSVNAFQTTEKRWSHFTAIPASSVYFDDALNGEMVSGVPENQYSVDALGGTTPVDQEDTGKILWFKFRGSRIDIYCTTDSDGKYVVASIMDENGNAVSDENGNKLYSAVKAHSETARYNVPALSFDGLDPTETHYLRIVASKGANYRLDGIRVYHPMDESEDAVQSAYEEAAEQNAKYVNVRSILLGTEEAAGNISEPGALFYTDSGDSLELNNADYVANGPKNEVYLSEGEGVAFQIHGTYEKVAVGLSAPEYTGEATVMVTDGDGKTKNIVVSSVVDSYYAITPDSNGNVVIRNATESQNNGKVIVSVTNVKLSGKYTAPAGVQTESTEPLMVTTSLKSYATRFRMMSSGSSEEPVADGDSETGNEEHPNDVTNPEEGNDSDTELVPEDTLTPAESPVPDTGNDTKQNAITKLMTAVRKTIQSITKQIRNLLRW